MNDTLGSTSRTRTSGAAIDYVMCRATQTTIEPDTPALEVITDITYDPAGCGNPTELKVRGFNASNVELAARTTKLDYGARCQFAETVTDPMLQQTQLSYRYDLGLVTSVRDPNSLVTTTVYDSFGRVTKRIDPSGVSTDLTYSACNSANNFCGDGTLRLRVDGTLRDTAGNAIRGSVVFLDGLGRYRLGGDQLANGAFSYVGVTYDTFGRITAQTMPYTATLNGQSETQYDVLGRQILARLRDANGVVIRQRSLAYSGTELTLTDAKGNQTRRVFDALGNLRTVADSAPGGTTNYNYEFLTEGVLRISATDARNNVTFSETNRRGFQTRSVDPDLGTTTFVTNSLGEPMSQKDARNLTTTFGPFDILGRPTTRTEPEGTTSFTWGRLQDNTATEKYVGRLKSVAGPEYSESYVYDALGRPKSTTVTTPEGQFELASTYQSATGLLDTLTYPLSTAGYRLRVQYDYQYGIQVRAKDANAPATVFWQLNNMNARGQFTDEQLGADSFAGKVRIQSNFDAVTGLLSSRQSGTQGSLTNRQNLTYSWDANNNLERRADLNQSGLYESFFYDALDRLTSSTRNGTTNLELSYDAIGNITGKTGVGGYTYPQSGANSIRPHAVTSAGSNSYGYDASGNMTARNGASITWNTANLPTLINHASGRSSKFSYTPDRQRWKQEATYAGGNETTIYVRGLMEKLTTAAGAIYYRHYISAGSGTVVYTRSSAGTAQTYFVSSDHLGSSSSITDSSGALVVNESFDAFGKRRGKNWLDAPTAADLTAIANTTRQGFTGQEHLDNVDLIHMNGRVLDPTIGRFISADPLVQSSDQSQSLNRYSYVFNNPLRYTDPSGFRGESSPVDNIRPDGPKQSFSFNISFDGSLGGFVQFVLSFAPVEPNVSAAAPADTASQLRDQRRSPTQPVAQLEDLTIPVYQVPDQNLTDAVYIPGFIPPARLDAGPYFSLTVNGSLNIVNSAANAVLNLAAFITQPLDTYSGELITLETAFPPSAIGVLPALLVGRLSQGIRAAEAANALVPGGISLRAARNVVNPLGLLDNCGACAIAGDAFLAGRPASATASGPLYPAQVAAAFGKSAAAFSRFPSLNSISQYLQRLGPGSRGIVYGYEQGQPFAHYFNAVNQNGKIVFLDFQSGTLADTSAFNVFLFLRTN